MKRKFKILSLILVIMLILSSLMPLINVVNAEDRTTGSLTINKQESDEPHNPIEGVEFTIYKVDEDYDEDKNLAVPEYYNNYVQDTTDDQDGRLYKATQTTNESGQATFNNLPLGRYLVIESNAPAKVPEKTANFLVDIPRTDNDGKTLTYDVTVSPKNVVILKDYEIEKKDRKTDSPIDGVTFKLQKESNSGEYKDYESATVQTSGGGKAGWQNLPVGKYQIVETEAATGYILDTEKAYKFEVYYDSKEGESGIKVTNADGSVTKYSADTPTVIENEKPTLNKEIVDANQVGNKVQFKLTIDIPTMIGSLEKYTITDTMGEGLKYVSGTLNIEGVAVVATEDYSLTSGDTNITIDFTEAGIRKLAALYSGVITNETDVKTITITYDAYIVRGKKEVADPYKNTAKLEYSSKTGEDPDTSSTEKDVTPNVGGFKIEKIDAKDNTPLAGAKFKIALSEEDAKSGTYLRDESGNEIELTSAESTGLAEYYGLKYGTYYLVETEAPIVKDLTDEKGENIRYNKLRSPQKIVIDANSYEDTNQIQIKNRKGLVLPLTGGIGAVLIFAVGLAFISTAIIIHKKDKENN